MAAADLKLEVTCSICTEIYTNPITLICGHSFCQDCITKTFDNQHDREYFCPECMHAFTRRPELKKNPRLSNIAEHFHSVAPKGEGTGSVCSLCPLCEAFLCDFHKQTYMSPEHFFTDPTTSLEDRRCPIHQKILECYCTVDDMCICDNCLTSDHNGHKVITINEFLLQKERTLKPTLEKISSKRQEKETMIQNLQEQEKTIHEAADGIAERVIAKMRDIRRQQEDLEKRILDNISRKKQQISHSISNHVQQLQREKMELHKKMTETDELSRNTNPLSALHTSEHLFSAVGDKHPLDKGMAINTIYDVGDLDEEGIFETLSSRLSYIVMGARDVHEKKFPKV